MGYKLMKSIDHREPTLAYEDAGPGLYEGESVVKLDSGELVAVSVSSRRTVNGAGVTLKAWARWIEDDGTTKLDGEGQEVENDFIHNVDVLLVDKYGIADLSKEMLLAVLGEPLTQVKIENPNPEGPETLPVINWPEEVLLNVSIRNAIDNARKTNPTHDAAALLKR